MVAIEIILFTSCDFKKGAPRNIKLVTYNVQQLADPFGDTDGEYSSGFGSLYDDEERAALIALNLKAADIDVIVLNEVLDEDSREIFSTQLGTAYPYHIDKIDNDVIDEQDSGLMLFSKHPFMSLSSSEFKIEEDNVTIITPPGFPENKADLVRFTPFNCAKKGTCYGLLGSCDCYAAKGAGIVKLKNKFTGVPFYVVFTHLQADYGEDDEELSNDKREVRRGQFQAIASLVKNVVLPAVPTQKDGITVTGFDQNELKKANIFILGDLNVEGNPNYFFKKERAVLNGEWGEIYQPNPNKTANFFSCGNIQVCAEDKTIEIPIDIEVIPTFIDSWGFDTDSEDLGRTNDGPFIYDYENSEDNKNGKRLDYILYRGPSIHANSSEQINFIVPQHLTIEWDLAGKYGLLSDHLPVGGNFLIYDKSFKAVHDPISPPIHSTPLNAKELDISESDIMEIKYLNSISMPGAMQWFKMNDSLSTYSIAVPPNFGFDVYKPYDLSRPISFEEERNYYISRVDDFEDLGMVPIRKEKTIPAYSKVYNFTDPPYYIRTYAKKKNIHDREFFGEYFMYIRKHQCRDPDDACILTPSKKHEGLWPGGSINENDTKWFLFKTNIADNGEFPNLEFVYEKENPKLDYESSFIEKDFVHWPDQSQLSNLNKPLNVGSKMVDTVFINSLTGNNKNQRAYYLKISRKNEQDDKSGDKYSLTFTTNLTYFQSNYFWIEQEEDDSASDELHFFFRAETNAQEITAGNLLTYPERHYLGEFQDDPVVRKIFTFNRRFVGRLSVRMTEEDNEDGNLEASDFLICRGEYDKWFIPELPRHELARNKELFKWRDTGDGNEEWDDTDYAYLMLYKLSHVPIE